MSVLSIDDYRGDAPRPSAEPHGDGRRAEAAASAAASAKPDVNLSSVETSIAFSGKALKELVTQEVLTMFRWSLIGTLSFAGALASIDALFIWAKIIQPADRLITTTTVAALVAATVVQVGSAFAAIVISVFKDTSSNAD